MSMTVYIGEKATDINLNNRNAIIFCQLFDAKTTDDGVTFTFDPFKVLINIAEVIEENRIEEFCPVTTQEGNWVNCGLSKENFLNRLKQFESAALRSIETSQRMYAC